MFFPVFSTYLTKFKAIVLGEHKILKKKYANYAFVSKLHIYSKSSFYKTVILILPINIFYIF